MFLGLHNKVGSVTAALGSIITQLGKFDACGVD